MTIDFTGIKASLNVIFGGILALLGSFIVIFTTISVIKAYLAYSMKDEEEQNQKPFTKIAVRKIVEFLCLGLILMVIGFVQIFV